MTVLEQRIFDFTSKEGYRVHKPTHYAAIYDRLLYKYVNNKVTLMEIGIGYGGCLQMWAEYLGYKAEIIGVDLNDTAELRKIPEINKNISLFLGIDQGRPLQLRTLVPMIPRPDVIIDDGSHFSKHQIDTFEIMFPHLSPGGLYVVEDTHTSYRGTHDGGYKRQDTFLEYCKKAIDVLHYAEDERILADHPTLAEFKNSIEYIQILWTMVIIKKKEEPHAY